MNENMNSIPKEFMSVLIRYSSYSWNYWRIPGIVQGARHMPDFSQIFGERNLVTVFIYFILVHCLPHLHYFKHKQLQSRDRL